MQYPTDLHQPDPDLHFFDGNIRALSQENAHLSDTILDNRNNSRDPAPLTQGQTARQRLRFAGTGQLARR